MTQPILFVFAASSSFLLYKCKVCHLFPEKNTHTHLLILVSTRLGKFAGGDSKHIGSGFKELEQLNLSLGFT